MKCDSKLYLNDEKGVKFFGLGPCRLLELVGESGSLSGAAREMELSYSKALRMVKDAENATGLTFLIRGAGGKNGGGSVLTDEGKNFIEKYRLFEKNARLEIEKVFLQIF